MGQVIHLYIDFDALESEVHLGVRGLHTRSGTRGYIPVLGWGGANHEFLCMHITSYSGPERQREPRSGFRICLAVVCEEL
jgi:hypothetical protein